MCSRLTFEVLYPGRVPCCAVLFSSTPYKPPPWNSPRRSRACLARTGAFFCPHFCFFYIVAVVRQAKVRVANYRTLCCTARAPRVIRKPKPLPLPLSQFADSHKTIPQIFTSPPAIPHFSLFPSQLIRGPLPLPAPRPLTTD
ncbi:hypothetical protein BCV70DRAFT_19699 [Testicularia cyperi]|uniref:Uncharacterized protein n=1 Tax=Testicularia cyperi TaxID=1882483 RepID=A0A317Y044_9BASI|nr:hypothetical protein BCV70DRAFT_19699 [Testicularia cyperi]